MRAVFLDFGSVTRGDLDCTALEQAISPWQFYDETDLDRVAERIEHAEIVVCNKFSLKRDIIESASRLKLICIAATGFNNIDLAAAAEYNIAVCNVRGYATPSVVQHVFMLMLNLYCGFESYRQLVNDGRWQTCKHFCPLDFSIQELSGKILGIIGFGELGQAVSTVAKAFGMQVLVAEHKNQPVRKGRTAFEDVLRQADFVTLHCPLSDDTCNLIARHELNLMKSTAYLINTARGAIINEADLLEALTTDRIAGAGLDVLSKEPPVHDNPLLQYRQPNLIITPHVAWASRESRQRLINQIANNIHNFFNHKPFNQVTVGNTIPATEFQIRVVRWADEMPSLRAVREAVFIHEQHVPEEMEWDTFDQESTHVLATDSDGQPIGTARLLPDGHIGRMAVLKSWRNRGVGSAMLKRLLDEAQRRGMSQAILNAQVTASAFYARFGFQVVSDTFMEAEIPHIKMELKL